MDKEGKQGAVEELDRSQIGSNEPEFHVDTPKKLTVVVKGPDGKPMAGLVVWPVAVFGESGIGMSTMKTDALGEVTFDGLWKGGAYRFQTARTDLTAPYAAIRVKGDGPTEKLEMDLETPARTQKGMVVDAAGKPVAGAWVWASALKGATTETDADGRFTLTGLPSAPVEIGAYDSDAQGKATASCDTLEVVIKLDEAL